MISHLNGEEITVSFYEKELQKTSQKNLEQKKYLDEKVVNCTSNGTSMIVILLVGLIKKVYKMSQYFPKPFRSLGGSINVKVGLSNYATKTNLKNIKNVDTSNFALKTNLASLKIEVDKLDIDKLAPVLVDLSKPSDVVKNDVAKKAAYDKLVAKVNNIDTSNFALKTKYQIDKTELEKKIPDVSNLAKKAKLTELENKIPDVSSLATKTALTAVENKIPSVSNLVKKQTMTQKLLKLKRNLLIIIMTNILQLQSLMLLLLMFLMRD